MKELFDMFMDIIPGNIIQPFIDSNMMQIIIIALALGVIILGLDNRVEYIRGTVVDLYAVFASAMELVCKLLPLFIFTSLLLTFWENGSDTIAKLWKPVLVSVLTQMGYIFVMGGYISVKYKVKISKLFAKILPSCLIGLTTASSIAAYGKGNEINKTKLGIDGRYSDLAYPLGISLYDATYSPLFIVIPFYLAEMFGVQVSAFWFIKTCVICLIVTYAAPQVPGGALICLTVILTQLGIPIEGLSVAGVLAMVLDFFTTGSKVAGQHFEMILQADHLGMLDREVLKE